MGEIDLPTAKGSGVEVDPALGGGGEAKAGPTLSCPVCDAPVHLNGIMTYGDERILVCPVCHHREIWRLTDDPRNHRQVGRP